jgi:hypothetical protein
VCDADERQTTGAGGNPVTFSETLSRPSTATSVAVPVTWKLPIGEQIRALGGLVASPT